MIAGKIVIHNRGMQQMREAYKQAFFPDNKDSNLNDVHPQRVRNVLATAIHNMPESDLSELCILLGEHVSDLGFVP